jgi:hypothetical protein
MIQSAPRRAVGTELPMGTSQEIGDVGHPSFVTEQAVRNAG